VAEPKLIGQVLGRPFIQPAFVPEVTAFYGIMDGEPTEIAAQLDKEDPEGGIPEWRLMRDGEVIEFEGPGAEVIQALVDKLRLDAFGWRKNLDRRREAFDGERAEAFANDWRSL
jgi:hypothetical protein